jgi:hypothetical protein
MGITFKEVGDNDGTSILFKIFVVFVVVVVAQVGCRILDFSSLFHGPYLPFLLTYFSI